MKIHAITLATIFVLLVACTIAVTGDAPASNAVAEDTKLVRNDVLAAAENGQKDISTASEQKWGNLSGRFLYGGEPPQRTKVSLNKDVQYCSIDHPLTDNLIVDEKSRGIANVVVWLRPAKRGLVPPIHESYAQSEKSKVILSNDKCRFKPHVCVVRTSQTLLIKNVDTIDHNTAAFLGRNLPFNSVTSAGASDERKFRKAERKPAKISCSIHSWMTGWLMVQDHPYVAVTDQEGRFTIKHLPTGDWTFQVWHEIPEEIEEVAISDGDVSKKVEWDKGRVQFSVNPGENDFGEYVISEDQFK